jgi:hypothetical protein
MKEMIKWIWSTQKAMLLPGYLISTVLMITPYLRGASFIEGIGGLITGIALIIGFTVLAIMNYKKNHKP